MATQLPITFTGTFPDITGFTQLKAGDTLAGVVNHADFSPSSLMFSDDVGAVSSVVIPDNAVLGNTGAGITSITIATLAPIVALELSIDDLFTTTGLNNGDTVVYSNGNWTNLNNTLGNLSNVDADAPYAGSLLVFTGTTWEAQVGPPVDGQIYGYQNGAWVRVPVSDGSGGTLNHSSLANLLVDTHTQYHTDARGDVRYYQKAEVDGFLANKAPLAHQHVLADITDSGTLAAQNTVSSADIDSASVGLDKIDPTFSSEGQLMRSTGPGTDPTWTTIPAGLSLAVSSAAPGTKTYFVATTNWRITGWYVVATEDNTTLELDIIKSSGSVPTELDSIVGTEPPRLVSEQLSSDLALNTWSSLDVTQGDVVGVRVVTTNGASELVTLSLVGYQL